MIVQLVAGALGGQKAFKNSYKSALSMEVGHTASLIHDDLPSMDNDSLRRGKPTLHTIIDPGLALLIGDSMIADCYGLTAEACIDAYGETPKGHWISSSLVRIISESMGSTGVCFGQWIDLSDSVDDWESLKSLHELKTGALLALCMQVGYYFGIADNFSTKMISQAKEDASVLKKAGLKLGLAFQIIDDVLDETQSSETLGKTAGKDSIESKTTSVSVLGIEKSIALANKLVSEASEEWSGIYSKNKPIFSVFSKGCNKSLLETFKYLVERTK
jgi:geranylgeranyl pyrophosphate synthase